MDSIIDILGKRDFDEPSEIIDIKNFINQEYGHQATVQLSGSSIVVNLPNASLVNTVRLRVPEIRKKYKIEKKFIFRINAN
jgi:hypothetical protein